MVSNVDKQNTTILPLQQTHKTEDPNQLLIRLVSEALNPDTFAAKIHEIKQLAAKEQFNKEKMHKILLEHGFMSTDADKIVKELPWNHREVMSQTEAEQILVNAPDNAWLIRICPHNRKYVISYKTGKNVYQHFIYAPQFIDDLLKGLKKSIKLWDMVVNEEVIKTHPYNCGNLTAEQAEEVLSQYPIGSWLLHFSVKIHLSVFSVKLANGIYRHFEIPTKQCENTTLGKLFQQTNASVKKENNINLRLNLSDIYPRFTTPYQLETFVTDLFNKIMLINPECAATLNGSVLKLSRRQYTQLPTSFIIEGLSNGIKIHQIVHGPGGFIGKGHFKIVKFMQSLTDEVQTAICKFKSSAEDTEYENPEMMDILRLTRGMPYVAEGWYVSLQTKAYIFQRYAKTSLAKLIEDGLSDNDKNKYAVHMLIGLSALHEEKIAHRDIKPDNILIVEDSQTHEDGAYLTDLDFATRLGHRSRPGTPVYQPPEVRNKVDKTITDLLKADIYAMGMTLYELYHKKHLWFTGEDSENIEFYDKYNRMSEAEILVLFPEPKANTVDYLFWLMMHPNPYQRPTAKQALAELYRIKHFQSIV